MRCPKCDSKVSMFIDYGRELCVCCDQCNWYVAEELGDRPEVIDHWWKDYAEGCQRVLENMPDFSEDWEWRHYGIEEEEDQHINVGGWAKVRKEKMKA